MRKIDQSGQLSVLVLLDLSSAFDTVDNNIFLDARHKRFGVTGSALDWYRSYLCNRTQTLQVRSDKSTTFVVDCSVPQGSVLGPLKFVVYTENLPAVIEQHHSTMTYTSTTHHCQIIHRYHLSLNQLRILKAVFRT